VLLVDEVLEIHRSVGRVDAVVDHLKLLPDLLRGQQSLGIDLVVLGLNRFEEVVLCLTRLSWRLVVQTVDFDPRCVQDWEDTILLHDLVINHLLAGEDQLLEKVEQVAKEGQLHQVVDYGGKVLQVCPCLNFVVQNETAIVYCLFDDGLCLFGDDKVDVELLLELLCVDC